MNCEDCKLKGRASCTNEMDMKKRYCPDWKHINSIDYDDRSNLDRWEQLNGRGFWGNSSSGYIEDKRNR